MNPILNFWNGLKPTELLTVSEWADKNRYLSSESAAEAGKWRTSRTPYLRQIMDDLSPTNSIQEVIVIKSVQLGFTEAGLNTVGCFVDIAPCPILYVMPTIEMAKGVSRDRVDSMVQLCPNLSKKIRPARERDSGNTVLKKTFPGGLLVFAGSNSGSELRSRPMRLLVLDEIDAYPLDVNGEGSPISLAEKRTTTFSNRKIFKLSTPTIKGVSGIEKAIGPTDQRKYFVPLPCCGVLQTLEFSQLRWEKGDYQKTKYECKECGELVEERHKPKILEAGEWIATQPENASPQRTGYIISGLYSPLGWMSWGDIAKEFDESVNDLPKRITFTNTMLGETYEATGESPDFVQLYNKREQYKQNTLNEKICFVTAGVDIQGDRIEIEVVGWGVGRESWSIDYRVLLGDTTKSEVWQELANIIVESWPHASGGNMGLAMCAIDSGYNTTLVYDFCQKFDYTRVIPIKGQDKLNNVMVSPPRAVNVMRDGKKVNGLKVWHVNTSMIKTEIYGFLKSEQNEAGEFPNGYCHFPQYDRYYFQMLTAEQLIIKVDSRGFRKAQWELKFQRNEALDCRVYARAAAHVMGMDMMKPEDFESLKAQKITMGKQETKTKKPKKKSNFW